MALGGNNLAGAVRVAYEASTGQFNVDNAEAERKFALATQGISASSLRVELAQRRLRRELAASTPNYDRVLRATLALKSAQREAAATTALSGREYAHAGQEARHAGEGFRIFGRDVERAGAGAVIGSKAIRGLRSVVLFGGASVLSGFGISTAVRAVLGAAKDQEQAQAGLRAQLAATGISYQQNREEIEKTIRAQGQLSAFDDQELTRSFTTIVRRTGDVNQALQLNAVAADVARGRHVDLASAANLVVRAMSGNASAARRLGLDVQAVTTHQDALRASGEKVTTEQLRYAKAQDQTATSLRVTGQLQEKYNGQAAAFGRSEGGAQARFGASLKETEVIIGNALLPTLNRLLNRGSHYLRQLNDSGRLQRDVNATLKTAGDVVHDVETGFHDAQPVLREFNHLVGGTRHEVRLLIALFAAWKIGALGFALKGIAGGIRGVGSAAALATPEVNAFKTAEERPDFGPGGGRGGPGGAPIVPVNPFSPASRIPTTDFRAVAQGGLGARLLARFGAGATDLTLGGGGFILPGISSDQHPGATVHTGQVITQGGKKYVIIATADGRIAAIVPESQYKRALLEQQNRGITADSAITGGGGQHGALRTNRHGAPPPRITTRRPPGDPAAIPLSIQQQDADAGLTGNQADDRAALTRERDFIRRQLARAKLTAAQRLDLTNQLGSALQQIQSIDDQAAQKAAAARRAAQARARAAEQRRFAVVTDRLSRFASRVRTADRRENFGRERRLLNDEADYLRKEIRDKTLTLTQRRQLERDLRNVNAQLDGLRAKEHTARVDERLSIFARRVTRAQIKTPDDTSDEVKVLRAEDAYLTRELRDKHLSLSRRKTLRARIDTVDKQLAAALKKTPTGGSRAEQQAFIAEYQRIVGAYAPNSTPVPPPASGKTDTHLYNVVHESRQTNQHLLALIKRTSFPASGYATSSASAALG